MSLNRAKLDMKSVVIGLLSGVLVIVAFGASDLSTTRPVTQRFEISAWSQGNDRHGVFVVDTETGDVTSILGRTTIGGGNVVSATYAIQRVQR